ncbi:ABC transporter permease [Sulfidibacter corallicola]|uniref:ABC transporter permease n=1 Tax=Sulfidibacter corallicola TaxID=2818388 RepID=A0A8A4THK2_SULCO|nr:ABC transporter permease [Sulfidibacter corallicola]QTD49113.1 ABC transporter permease [Sulfidibacter corallicola]
MFRGLLYYWRIHTAALLGMAIAASVLIGALLIGDSVRSSLRHLALARLGALTHALAPGRFFDEDFADRLHQAASPGDRGGLLAAPLLLVEGNATAAGTRASGVQVLGVDDRFVEAFGSSQPLVFETAKPGFPAAVINRALAAELGIDVGDDLLLSFQNPSDLNREAILSHKDTNRVLRRLRVQVAEILPDAGLGGFAMGAAKSRVFNVFLPLDRLQRELEREGLINVAVVSGVPEGMSDEDLTRRIGTAMTLGDLGLAWRLGPDSVTLESRSFFFDEAHLRMFEDTAARLSVPDRFPVFTYLANRLGTSDRAVPYSTVCALPIDAARPGFRVAEGEGGLDDEGIWLNAWTAAQLQVGLGDRVVMDFFQVEQGGESRESQVSFEVQGIVEMSGMGVDANLSPTFPGIEDADNMSDWDPPFQMNLSAIRPVDETYWDDYRAAPKAFVTLDRGRRMWHNRFGEATGFRLLTQEPEAMRDRWRDELKRVLTPEFGNMAPFPLRRLALEGAAGATDFTGLFIAFSFFLIAAALGLLGMLMRLAVSERSREIGTRLALGFPPRKVRAVFVREGLVLAAAGSTLGVFGAWGFAAVMMYGMRHWWGLGTSVLELHVSFLPALVGWVSSVLVAWLTVVWAVRDVRRLDAARLLAGGRTDAMHFGKGRARWVRALALLLGLGCLVSLAFVEQTAGPAFGLGVALLVAGLAQVSLGFRPFPGDAPFDGLTGMARRNLALFSGRALLSVFLVAAACFVLVVTGLSKYEGGADAQTPGGPAGGYDLVAESDVPLFVDLSDEKGWDALTLDDGLRQMLAETDLVPMRLLPGDDASCLNLFAPRKPRILGLPNPEALNGRFTFFSTLEPADNPWTLLNTEFEDGAIPVIGDFNSILWILKSGLGKDIVVPNAGGEPLRLRIVATVNKSIFQSELIMAESQFLRAFPDRAGFNYYLMESRSGDPQALMPALERGLAEYGLDAKSTGQLLAGFHAIENTYISIFQVLGGLGLLLGTLGLALIVLRNALERAGELATLQALGFSQNRLLWLQFAEMGLVLSKGMLVGSLSALVAVLPQMYRVDAGPAVEPVLYTLAAVFLTGMLATRWAVGRVLRLPLLENLKAR